MVTAATNLSLDLHATRVTRSRFTRLKKLTVGYILIVNHIYGCGARMQMLLIDFVQRSIMIIKVKNLFPP